MSGFFFLATKGGINSYTYNAPTEYADPTGLFVRLMIPGVCAAGGCEAVAAATATAAA